MEERELDAIKKCYRKKRRIEVRGRGLDVIKSFVKEEGRFNGMKMCFEREERELDAIKGCYRTEKRVRMRGRG